MTFDQAHQYLVSLINIPREEYMSDPRRCGVYLKRLQLLLDILGNPEKKIPHYIHVGGTSGKGSMTGYFSSILKEHGVRVGTLISPHVSDVRERWQVNGKMIPKKRYIEVTLEMKKALDIYAQKSPYSMVSFDEMKTAFALLYFAQEKVEWCVLEVGCGGRFDATNVLPYKDVAVITNVGLDHMEILGNTTTKIAKEKAGIIAKKTPVFTTEKDPKIQRIFKKEAQEKNASYYQVTPTYSVTERSLAGSTFIYKNETYDITAPGIHQIENAILSIEVMQHVGISTNTIQRGLTKAAHMIRMEILQESPCIIMDGAHNEDKMRSSVESLLADARIHKGNIHLVLGFANNKQVDVMLKILARLRPATIVCTRNTMNPFRKVIPPATLADLSKKIIPKAKRVIYLDPVEGLAFVQKKAKKNDIILVTGSIFLAGELRKEFLGGI